MAFEVLGPDGEHGSRWTALIAALAPGLRDIHFLPEYGRIHRDTYGFAPLLATWRGEDGFVIQPFVRRPLGELPFLAGSDDASAYADLANAYGYGGPLCQAPDMARARELYRRFADAFAAWCEREHLASEFTSLHPFMAEHQMALVAGILSPRHEKDVVYIDLAGGGPGMARGLRKGHRSSIAAAVRAGVTVTRAEPTASNLRLFGEIHRAILVRRQAASRWYFPESFFPNHARHLGPQRFALFFAALGGEVEGACVLMQDFGTAYYHFAGTYGRHPTLGVSNLMVHETALWAAATGFARYHLGGGVTAQPDDSLLRFKAGFSALRAPLYNYFCVRDHVMYDHLCERKRAHERTTAEAETASGFVPFYRR